MSDENWVEIQKSFPVRPAATSPNLNESGPIRAAAVPPNLAQQVVITVTAATSGGTQGQSQSAQGKDGSK